MQEISSKNTKNTILEAYEEAQEEIKALKRVNRKEVQAVEKKREVVQEATKNAPEPLVKNLTDLKTQMNTFATDFAEQISSEFEKLTTLQQAIEIEKENLETFHDINGNADSLETLLLAQTKRREEFDYEMQVKKTAFEEDMSLKRSQFKQEQTTFESQFKEEKECVKKERQREEDNYQYKLKTERSRDTDVYANKKATLERELKEKKTEFEKSIAEREANLKAKATEFSELQKQVNVFPQTLENAVKNAEKNLREKLETHYKYEVDLRTKEYSGEIKLCQQMIASLKDKIKEQEDYIAQLTQRTSQANTRVQEIALKAIESSSSNRHLSSAFERQGVGFKHEETATAG